MPDVAKTLTAIFGSFYLLIVLSIMLVLPILQLAFGVVYRHQCPINANIPIYLTIAGACGIALIVLALSMVSSYHFFKAREVLLFSRVLLWYVLLNTLLMVCQSPLRLVWVLLQHWSSSWGFSYLLGSLWYVNSSSQVDSVRMLGSHRAMFGYSVQVG